MCVIQPELSVILYSPQKKIFIRDALCLCVHYLVIKGRNVKHQHVFQSSVSGISGIVLTQCISRNIYFKTAMQASKIILLLG